MFEGIIARKNSDGSFQSLYAHSKNVAEISMATSKFPNISILLAYLHDLGKISKEFQNYIQDGGDRGSVIHAWQGAFIINDLALEDSLFAALLKEIIGFCVTAHHNHLDDGLAPDGISNYHEKFLNIDSDKYFLREIRDKLTDNEKVIIQELFRNAEPELSNILKSIKEIYKDKKSANFAIGLLIKYLFSCLVDADRLDAYLFESKERYEGQAVDWSSLIEIFENKISGFPKEGKINEIRNNISEKCKRAAEKPTGIYQLSVPTGGGKTLSSLRFALHHCEKYHKKRIIYVIPYLSIIEQTADSLNKILSLSENNDVILEHHSNVVKPEDEKSAEIRKVSSARWDTPIVITTMVQFLETVMSAKSGKLRKFASMADAVIIFDEIQTMPVKAIHCFNETASFLSKVLNSTIILCSATQPTLESTQRKNLMLQDESQLIDCSGDFKDIKRVTVAVEEGKDYNQAADFVMEKAIQNDNCLVIVNTKKSALELYNRLNNEKADFEVFHLSTSMYPVHRTEVIEKIKISLIESKRVICVSTQLIEAGVDISFSCVVRAMAGLDSIAQAAGRCNRNGESVEPKTVYTFSLTEENIDKLIDIKLGKEISEEIIENNSENTDLLDGKAMKMYYRQYFNGREGLMDYPTKEGLGIYSMLAGNDYGRKNYKNRTGNQFPHLIPYAFHTADMNFNVIDGQTKSVVVMHKEAIDLVYEYRKQPVAIATKEKIEIVKTLQKFAISLYEWQLKTLDNQGALSLLDEDTGIILLDSAFYSNETGVILEAIQRNAIV